MTDRKPSRTTKPAATKTAKKPAAPPDASPPHASASDRITTRIAELRDWRGETLALVRRLVREADPAIVEEWKWDVPVWSRDGIVCTGEVYEQAVKLTFPKGASLADAHGLFNASLAGNARRAIDLRAGDEIDVAAFTALIREAVAFNRDHPSKGRRASAR